MSLRFGKFVILVLASLAACGGPKTSAPQVDPLPQAEAGDAGQGAGGGPARDDAGGPASSSCNAFSATSVGDRIPAEHRATAKECAPSSVALVTDAGGGACLTDSDCASASGTLFTHCLRGQCSFDACLVDADCANGGICGCSSDYYGGNVAIHPNVCVPGNCRVDSDCGVDGACSPSRGRCGSFEGFYCHGVADTCVDPKLDCQGCDPPASSCIYAPTVGHFMCGGIACGG